MLKGKLKTSKVLATWLKSGHDEVWGMRKPVESRLSKRFAFTQRTTRLLLSPNENWEVNKLTASLLPPTWSNIYRVSKQVWNRNAQCVKITENVAFELFSFGTFQQFCPIKRHSGNTVWLQNVEWDFFYDFPTLWDG